MKKCFFLVLMGIFLGACGGPVPGEVPGGDSPPNSPPEAEDGSDSKEPKPEGEGDDPAPGRVLLTPLQACRANLINATWTCTKEEEVFNYFLNHRSTTIDEPGTLRARTRICELHAKKADQEASQVTLLAYAHYERNHCVNTLNIEITEKQKEGFKCSGQENLDENRADTPC